MATDSFPQGLQLMPQLFDNFYTATWVLLTAPEKGARGREGNRAVVVASSNRREGASTVALNLAHAFSSSSMKSVVLVDGNLRDPALHEFFSRKREGGLTELVHGEIAFEQAVTEVKPRRLHFISSGRQVPNPIMLYEMPEFKRLLDQLRNIYDLIIFDSSPVIRYPETPMLASATDGLLLVLEAEGTRWEVAEAAKSALEIANVNILGAILNKREYVIPPAIYKLL